MRHNYTIDYVNAEGKKKRTGFIGVNGIDTVEKVKAWLGKYKILPDGTKSYTVTADDEPADDAPPDVLAVLAAAAGEPSPAGPVPPADAK
jgi:hypothetical protein